MVEFASTPEVAAPTKTRTLGAAAVVAVNEAAHYAHALEVVRTNAGVIDELIEEGVPDPRFSMKITRLGRRLLGKHYASHEDQAAIKDWLNANNMPHLRSAPRYLEVKVEDLEDAHSFAQQEKARELAGVRTMLSEYSEVHQKELNDFWDSDKLDVPEAFKAAKLASEVELGAQVPWVEWIATYTDDALLASVLEWGMHKVESDSATPEMVAKIERVKKGFAQGLQVAHEQGILNKGSLKMATTKLEALQIQVFHPLSLLAAHEAAKGVAYRDEGYVEIREDASDFAVYHEVGHTVFGRFTPLFDEAGIQMATDYIFQAAGGTERPKFHYDEHDVVAARQLIAVAGMSESEWLRLVMDRRTESIERYCILAEAVVLRTGFDIVTFLELGFGRLEDKYSGKDGSNARVIARELTFEELASVADFFIGRENRATPNDLAMWLLDDVERGGEVSGTALLVVTQLIEKHYIDL